LERAGWSCILATLTCTRGDTLAQGSEYPVITLTVRRLPHRGRHLTNTATVSCATEAGFNYLENSASDPTTVIQIADLTIQIQS